MSDSPRPDSVAGSEPAHASQPSAATDREPARSSAPGPTNHRALIYETREEQLAAVVPFVRQGLEQGDRVMYIADENAPDDLTAAFRGAGIDVGAALDSGQLTFHSPTETYVESGDFEADEMTAFLEETVEDVTETAEFGRLRIIGEMTWVLDEDVDTLDRLAEYEGKLNEFYPGRPVTGLCQYNRTRFDTELLYDIIRAHPHQVYNATVTPNIAYVPPEEYFDPDSTSADVEEFVETHLDRIRAHGQRQEREQSLAALAEASQRLVHGDTDAIVDQTVATVAETLSPSVVAVHCYDEGTDELRPEEVWLPSEGDPETTSLPDQYREMLRDTFETDDPRVFSNAQSAATLPALETTLQSGMVFPLDRYGVLLVASTRPDAFDSTDVEVAKTVARSAHLALERAEHERTLERQNEQLRQLNEINRTIRRIDQALVRASSREEIERVVCERLSETESYRFVWIGDRDPLGDALVPREWAGDAGPYLDEVCPVDTTAGAAPARERPDGEPLPCPTRTALESGEVRAVENTLTTTEYGAWRRVALENNLYSALSVPLVHNQTEYGVLSVYGADPDALSAMEREVLVELGSTIAYAIDAAETKAGVHESRVTEVGLRVTDSRSRLRRLADRVGGTLDVETILPKSDSELRLFFSTDEPADTVLSVGDEMASVAAMRQVLDRDDGGLFEAVVSVKPSIPALMDAFDATVTELTATSDALDLVAAVPQSADVSAFAERLQEVYDETAVTSVKRVEQPLETRGSFFAAVEDRLTDRQLQAVRLAYHSGYFEWPRESTGTEVAESLGVKQPTFSSHLRAGERKVFSLLFDEPP